MVQASLEVVLPDSRQQEFLSVLNHLLEPTNWQPGCLGCSVWSNTYDQRRSRFVTEWQSEKDLNVYLKSARFRAVLVVAELSVEAPSIQIRSFSKTHGLEYITQLLNSDSQAGSRRRDIDSQPLREAAGRS